MVIDVTTVTQESAEGFVLFIQMTGYFLLGLWLEPPFTHRPTQEHEIVSTTCLQASKSAHSIKVYNTYEEESHAIEVEYQSFQIFLYSYHLTLVQNQTSLKILILCNMSTTKWQYRQEKTVKQQLDGHMATRKKKISITAITQTYSIPPSLRSPPHRQPHAPHQSHTRHQSHARHQSHSRNQPRYRYQPYLRY